MGALAAVMILTLVAARCATEETSDILTADIEAVDSYLGKLNGNIYNFGKDW